MAAAPNPRASRAATQGGYETGNIGRFGNHPSARPGDSVLAETQHLVFSLDQLVALGLSASAAQKRAATARLHRIRHEVHSLVPERQLTAKGRWMAAVLACGPGSALSHNSAGDLTGLRRYSGSWIHVTVPGRAGRRHRGVRIHRSTTLGPEDVELIDGIPCTTVARTLFDLSEVLTERQLEWTFDRAEELEVFNLRAMEDQLARSPTRPGAKRVRRLLERHRIGSAITDSELEERLFALLRATGCPMPRTQVWIDPNDAGVMVKRDFVWRGLKINVETDGGHHRKRTQMETDTRNDQRLANAGWIVIRITWQQLEEEPERVIATILNVLRRGGATW